MDSLVPGGMLAVCMTGGRSDVFWGVENLHSTFFLFLGGGGGGGDLPRSFWS